MDAPLIENAAPLEDHGQWWFNTWFECGMTRRSQIWRTLARRVTCVVMVVVAFAMAVFLAVGFAWLVRDALTRRPLQ